MLALMLGSSFGGLKMRIYKAMEATDDKAGHKLENRLHAIQWNAMHV